MTFLSLFQESSRHSKRNRRSQPRRIRLTLEPLETRLTPTFTLTDGHLVISGDEPPSDFDNPRIVNDQIDLEFTTGARNVLAVHLNGQEAIFSTGALSFIDINPGTGHNQIDVHAVPAGVPLRINSVDGGDGVTLGQPVSTGAGAGGSLDHLQGPITINGNGLGRVILDDSALPLDHVYTITNTSATRDGFGGLTYNAIRSLTLKTSRGADLINLFSTFPGTSYAVSTGANSFSTIHLGAGTLDGLNGHVTLQDGVDATSHVVLHDEGYSLARTYLVQRSLDTGYGILSRDGFEFLTVTGLQAIDLNGGFGNNTYNLEGNPAGPLTIAAGLGNDTFNLLPTGSRNLGFFATAVTLDGGGGANSLNIDDHQFGAPLTYVATGDFVDRAGTRLVMYTGMQAVTVRGSDLGSEFTIPSAANLTIDPGLGNSAVAVGNSLNGLGSVHALTILGHGHTQLTLDDGANSAPTNYAVSGNQTTRSPGSSIAYSGINNLVLDAGSGGNDIAVAVSPPGTPITIHAGAGGDLVHASPPSLNVNLLKAHLTVAGANGNTRFTLLDQSTSPQTFLVTDTAITGNSLSVSYQDLQSVAISGGSGGNQFRLATTSAAPPVSLDGGAGINSLTGADADTLWTITRPNTGLFTGGAFAHFANLAGGAGLDVFRFLNGGSISGRIDGGAAPPKQGNWLDYSAVSSGVSVNLQTGAAFGVAGGIRAGVANIQHAHGSLGPSSLAGSAQGNILIGGPAGDTLIGGAGRSLLIGDLGADTVTGGSGGDILIGDATTFDAMTTANEKALMAILAEWQSADAYETRFLDINTGAGGGLNGTFTLNAGATVKDDNVKDTVAAAVAATALDWFFRGGAVQSATGSATDTLINVQAGEHINNNTPAAFKDRTVTPLGRGGWVIVSGIITDPDPRDPFTLVVNWGDGTAPETFKFPAGRDGHRVKVYHRYRRSGNYTVDLSWHDPQGPANQATLPVHVSLGQPGPGC